MPRKRVVQTELLEQEYELLQRVAEKRGVTIKHGLREAIQQWISAHTPMSEDPLVKLKPVKTGVKTDSSKLHKLMRSENR